MSDVVLIKTCISQIETNFMNWRIPLVNFMGPPSRCDRKCPFKVFTFKILYNHLKHLTMKKMFVILFATATVFLQFCSSSKKTAANKQQPEVAKLTYEADVKPLISNYCSPCHIPPKGFKKAYVTFDAVKADVDEMIERVSKDPTQRGFMPFKKTQKLPDSVINVLVQWKAGGLLEK